VDNLLSPRGTVLAFPPLNFDNDEHPNGHMVQDSGAVTSASMEVDKGDAEPLSNAPIPKPKLPVTRLEKFITNPSLGSKSSRPSNNASSEISSSGTIESASQEATERSLAVAINGIQGSMNRLADVFDRFIARVPALEAVELIISRDDGLTDEEKIKLLNILFTRNLSGVYLGFDDDHELRRLWISHMLQKSSD
jgi:hypothetical protein